MNTIEKRLTDLASHFDPERRSRHLQDVKRQRYHLELVRRHVPVGGTVIDLGGGVGLFSVACAALGYRSVLLDDFSDAINKRQGDALLSLHYRVGVEVVSRDIIGQGIDFAASSADMVTAFETMEHWHNSPKALFHQVLEVLRPSGVFLLGVPNCVSIRRRVTVPFGRGKWSAMDDWYEEPVFRGHVREADVEDLHYIASDIGLVDARIIGRNWRMHRKRASVISMVADYSLRPLPAVCTDVYLIGKSPPGPKNSGRHTALSDCLS